MILMTSKEKALVFSRDKTIKEIQEQFSAYYPLLKIEFYRTPHFSIDKNVMKNVFPCDTRLSSLGFRSDKIRIEITDSMTVKKLEQAILTQTGLHTQVFRKSGKVWLETTATDNWTLREQNDEAEALQKQLKQERENPDDHDMW